MDKAVPPPPPIKSPRQYAGDNLFYIPNWIPRMAIYRSTQTLKPVDAAYIAGLIDGEGTVTLGRKHRNDNRQLVVSISSTERDLLEYVQKTAGVGKITGKRTYSTRHAPSYTYTVTNRQAMSLLKQIHEYLRTYKVDRCRLILDKYLALTPRNGKYTRALADERKSFEVKLLAIKP